MAAAPRHRIFFMLEVLPDSPTLKVLLAYSPKLKIFQASLRKSWSQHP